MTTAAGTLNAVERGAQPTSILPDPAQLEMLRAPDGVLPRQAISTVRGRGRPRGATNKRSKKVADYFVRKYGDPLDVLGQMMNTPLRQLVEVLIEAEGGEEREERLLASVDEAVDAIKALRRVPEANNSEVAGKLADAIENLSRVAERMSSGKPGKLALDALSLQLQATFRALEYVHGKQPISIDVAGKADLVVFAPEILKQWGIDGGELQSAIAERGLEAFDVENMRLIDKVEDGDFSDVEDSEQ